VTPTATARTRPGFLSAADFAFTRVLEAAHAEIRRELEAVREDAFVEWPERFLYGHGWTVFGFRAFGKRLDENCALCPVTAALVEAIPEMTTAGFSALAPGTRIAPHTGYTSTVLRCHLGLIVPSGCGLSVGGETRAWEEGRCLVFDDTVLHDAWNDGTTRRVVLLVDFRRERAMHG
jgi:aspartyl/asparaginyl beta-hydroxylase (cupin superfamily)